MSGMPSNACDTQIPTFTEGSPTYHQLKKILSNGFEQKLLTNGIATQDSCHTGSRIVPGKSLRLFAGIPQEPNPSVRLQSNSTLLRPTGTLSEFSV